MTSPTSREEVRQCIGLVNNYINVWTRRSHMLNTLPKITFSKVKFQWNKVEQDEFEEIKRVVARGILLAYPDFNEEFKMNTHVI